jgi:hypothetical protein
MPGDRNLLSLDASLAILRFEHLDAGGQGGQTAPWAVRPARQI